MNKSHVSVLSFICLVAFTLVGCQYTSTPVPSSNSTPEQSATAASPEAMEIAMPTESATNPHPDGQKGNFKEMWLQGTVNYLNLEGGFFGIISDNGQKILPMNLSAEYRQVGAVLKFKGYFLTDTMTIQQWGTPFKITEVQVIKPGKKVVAADT